MDRNKCKIIRTELNRAIAEVMAEFDGEYTVNLGNARFGKSDVTFSKLCITEGNAEDKAKIRWDDNCFAFGLTPDDRNRIVTLDGCTYRVTEINPRRPKYPFGIVETRSGKGLKAPKRMIMAALAASLLFLGACGYAPKTPSVVYDTCWTTQTASGHITKCIEGNQND